MGRVEGFLREALEAWQERIHRRPSQVCALVLALTVPLAAYSALNLGVDADNVRLISPDLDFMRDAAAFSEHFPTLDDSLLIVVDGETAELTREATEQLEARLAARGDVFSDVHQPAGGAFFERNGLLYRELDELHEFGDYLALLQPVLAQLAAHPDVSTLARLMRRGMADADAAPAVADAWPAVLDRFSAATVAVYDEYPLSVSWESLLLRGSALDPLRRRVIVAEPRLRFDALLAAAPALAAIEEEAAALDLRPERGVLVRTTGNPALNHEEMLGIAVDVGLAGILSFGLVTLVLWRALSAGRMVGAAAITLGVGLVWTAAFATAAVGRLNLVSISFGVLFIGLGVDFAIHLGLHYADALRGGSDPRGAARIAVDACGPALVICAVSTSIGFFAFVPTDYRGVGELGLIAGFGMFVILFLTLTLFPALLASWLRVDPATLREPSPPRLGIIQAIDRHALPVCCVAAAAGLAAIALLPGLSFDANVVRMRDPGTVSVQAFDDLLAASDTTPWYANVVAPSLESAESTAVALERLPGVARAVSASDFVPADQDEKLEALADLELLFATPAAEPAPPLSLGEQVDALRQLHAFLSHEIPEPSGLSNTPLTRSAGLLRDRLGNFLARIESDPDVEGTLAELERVLLGWLPGHIDRLHAALGAGPIAMDDLPPDLVRRMLASDGSARIQVFPRRDLADREALLDFADSVRAVAPHAAGLPVNLVEFGRATTRSLVEALALALVCVAVLLLALWRSPRLAALALAPLVLAALLTAGVMSLASIPFNFVNVIVLPLLLGVGIDSGIHLVQRARAGSLGAELLGTITARAVFYSAITTVASFGSLALSSHQGIASLGRMLVVAMLLSLLCNLVVLPALLRLAMPRRDAG